MDCEFPDPDEEFDLIHEDEYEVLKELEEFEKKKKSGTGNVEVLQKKVQAKDKLSTFTPDVCKELNSLTLGAHKELNTATSSVHKELNTATSNVHKELNTPTANLHKQLSTTNECGELYAPSTSKSIECNIDTDLTRKRNYDELFGDITDILDINELVDFQKPKEKKPRWDEPQTAIKAILDARKKFQEHSRGVSAKSKDVEEKKDSISLRVPRWNFVAVTRPHDAQRIYVRVRSNDPNKIITSTYANSNLLSVPYDQLKAEAEEIMIQNAKRASYETSKHSTAKIAENDELWVDKYRPQSYVDLLSNEGVNRLLLHWLKLWDKVVFNRNYVQSKKKKFNSVFRNRRFLEEKTVEEVDSKGFPIQRIVLLSGPPGLGKTTLAHLAAKHAGYNVVEINASDERSPDTFRQVLLSSTQMKAVIGNDPRPNCLVLDEIDGAPAPSIDLLLKFVQGKLIPKGKKGKTKDDKQSNVCHRPVICICNEPYTPSLRALRAIALIIPVPEVSPIRLADRLMEISQKENLKVNSDALLKLVEISGCDIRSCLGALQYTGGINLGENLSFALKDSQKGLFDSWKQILTIPMNKNGILPISERVRLVLRTVQNGESEKLAQGVFHNYPEICNEKMSYIVLCLQWFEFFDEIVSRIANLQTWSLMPYTNYSFVAWHLYFAKTRTVKLSYPSIFYELHQKQAKSVGILTTVQRSSGRNSVVLTVDIAPFLPDLLSPRLRTVSGHLHSAKEKDDIVRLVNILIDFGLTFTQEKNLDGTYDYKLDPDIFEIGVFPDCKSRRTLVYAVKQIIVQELEAERLRRAANMTKNVTNSTKNKDENTSKQSIAKKSTESKDNAGETKDASSVSNVTEKIKKVEEKAKEIVYKDFFGRIVTITPDKQNKSNKESTTSRDFLTKHGVWYKYKEGFSNAVRRTVIMQELL
ncbi:Chromosome transmission fidelity protein 18 homolog [Anthophora quadrimaculata]